MGALAPISQWLPQDDVLLKNAVEVKKTYGILYSQPGSIFSCSLGLGGRTFSGENFDDFIVNNFSFLGFFFRSFVYFL